VDRAKQGTKRSNLVDANGIPLAVIAARANANDSPLLGLQSSSEKGTGTMAEKGTTWLG
jgi:hypothetical protein